ncbi:hypothetical protein Hamer_G003107 [Homarus americanus]|uniref:Uncharacterized protein n=1 Tax=Homarus americanus TaxID=6706 RepID=A0A8J5N7U8_HOMAM|nr:hypothetical protein Hamer_G003107 [Homarus americanus]
MCIYAMKLAKSNPDTGKDFKATRGRCSRFMNRKGLVLRQKTKIAQKLSRDLKSKNHMFSTVYYSNMARPQFSSNLYREYGRNSYEL